MNGIFVSVAGVVFVGAAVVLVMCFAALFAFCATRFIVEDFRK